MGLAGILPQSARMRNARHTVPPCLPAALARYPRRMPTLPSLLALPALLACAGDPADDSGAGDVAAGDDTAGDDVPVAWSYPLDDVLRLSDVQAKGTHNSYHLAPDPYVVDDWDYSHAPLDVQASEQGVRQFELDVHLEDGELRVYHAAGLDEESTCATLAGCLDALDAWSAARPAHLPLVVLIEPKDDAGGERIDDYAVIEDVVAAHGPDAFTPAELRGNHATLADALATDGWATLGALRGRAIYGLLDRGDHRAAYRARGEGDLFVHGVPGEPDAALAMYDDARVDDVAGALALGMLVRVTADGAGLDDNAERRAAALAAGAQFLSSDLPAPVDGDAGLEIPGGTPARCNPVTAPPECTAEALEDPRFVE